MKWDVLTNYAGGQTYYQVYKRRNPKEPMHGGNIIHKGKCFDSKYDAEALAARLNADYEEKVSVLALLLPALQATTNLHDLVAMEYDDVMEIVTVTYDTGYTRRVNVSADSSTAMIVDVIKHAV